MTDSWLETATGRTPAWWVATVQRLVAEHSAPSDDPNHDRTDVQGWLTALVKVVLDALPPDESYDGNMRAGAILAQVLHHWYSRLHLAKVRDPNRPVALRVKAYPKWLAYQESMFRAALDEREDAVLFAGQRWSLPFDPKAESGGFV